jgi:hypothetical protein
MAECGFLPARWEFLGAYRRTTLGDGMWMSSDCQPIVREDGTSRQVTTVLVGEPTRDERPCYLTAGELRLDTIPIAADACTARADRRVPGPEGLSFDER